MRVFSATLLLLPFAFVPSTARGQESAPGTPATAPDDAPADGDKDVLAGHSFHGEVFNEGPRQRAYLMEGMAPTEFPVTARNPLVQKFIEQGVAQLHGFWYFEAERSFRQAAALEPECAMSYWGMSLANTNNEKRAKEFIAQAVKRKDAASERERLYIEALNRYYEASDKKKRAEQYTKDLEKLLYKFPDDLEAKAFLALQLWKNRSDGSQIASYLAVDALLGEVFAANPMHSAHHYRIHLWDYEKPEKALESSARCGQASPGIAHMWHMPGHIYSRLKRYNDAVWQQEASARVDHAHMMRDRVMPDQIHNFAHNNEWLIRNLIYVGRVNDAVDLAKNMIELPRHPAYNTATRRGSSRYGRMRLFQVLATYERWNDMIRLCQSSYLEPTEDETEQIKRLRHLGAAYVETGDMDHAQEVLAELHDRVRVVTTALADAATAAAGGAGDSEQKDGDAPAQATPAQATPAAGDAGKSAANPQDPAPRDEARTDDDPPADDGADKSEAAQKRRRESAKRTLDQAIDEIEGRLALRGQNYEEALKRLKQAGGIDAMLLARVQFLSGDTDEALKAARRHVQSHQGEVQPLAALADLLWQAGEREEARKTFDSLRELSAPIDLDNPVFQRLAPMAESLALASDWRVAPSEANDVGQRPTLDSLGPFRWRPSPANPWTLVDAQAHPHALKDYSGRPVLLIFYLGYSCLHCAEQLQAFAPKAPAFTAEGISIVAISTDDAEGLKVSLANYEETPLPFPLLTDAPLDVFRAYRAYDDFEKQPLHGTFLINEDGLVLWQDISYEPFMNPDFLLEESRRLLSQQRGYSTLHVGAANK